MSDHPAIYPHLSWALFEIYNDNRTEAFEDMCRDLFICEYLKESKNPHSDHNNPGVEVVPKNFILMKPLRDMRSIQMQQNPMMKFVPWLDYVSKWLVISKKLLYCFLNVHGDLMKYLHQDI